MSFMGRIDGDAQRYGGIPDVGVDAGAEVEAGPIDHGASARANLAAAGQGLKEAFTLDKTMRSIDAIRASKDMDSQGMSEAGLFRFLGVASIPLTLARDVAEMVYKPLVAVKDTADAAMHGMLSLFQRKPA